MNVCVLIPARGGSKGVPGKNIKKLNGKPLIQYTLDAALGCFSAKQIVVSTDSEIIKDVLAKLGFPVNSLRPEILALDTTPTSEVINYELGLWKKKYGEYPLHVVLLQVTSPFRNSEHLREAWSLYNKSEFEMLVSVCPAKNNPYYNLFEEELGLLKPIKEGRYLRRQDCPPVWELNGAIYIFNTKAFLQKGLQSMEKIKYEMSEINSLDIDTPLDWIIAEQLINILNKTSNDNDK